LCIIAGLCIYQVEHLCRVISITHTSTWKRCISGLFLFSTPPQFHSASWQDRRIPGTIPAQRGREDHYACMENLSDLHSTFPAERLISGICLPTWIQTMMMYDVKFGHSALEDFVAPHLVTNISYRSFSIFHHQHGIHNAVLLMRRCHYPRYMPRIATQMKTSPSTGKRALSSAALN
jgi:hypothetical protein